MDNQPSLFVVLRFTTIEHFAEHIDIQLKLMINLLTHSDATLEWTESELSNGKILTATRLDIDLLIQIIVVRSGLTRRVWLVNFSHQPNTSAQLADFAIVAIQYRIDQIDVLLYDESEVRPSVTKSDLLAWLESNWAEATIVQSIEGKKHLLSGFIPLPIPKKEENYDVDDWNIIFRHAERFQGTTPDLKEIARLTGKKHDTVKKAHAAYQLRKLEH